MEISMVVVLNAFLSEPVLKVGLIVIDILEVVIKDPRYELNLEEMMSRQHRNKM